MNRINKVLGAAVGRTQFNHATVNGDTAALNHQHWGAFRQL
jgi:hypothetical protein